MHPNHTVDAGRACRTCGGPVARQEEARGFYCSEPCYYASRRTRVPVACRVCGTVRQVKPSDLAKGRGRYCGQDCYRTAKMSVPITDRIWPRVNKGGPLPEYGAEYGVCWLWMGARNNQGYGHLGKADQTILVTHIAWELASSRRPNDDEIVGHVCDHGHLGCMRNDGAPGVYIVRGRSFPRHGHLWLGDHEANAHDAIEKGRGTGKISDKLAREIRERFQSGGVTHTDLARQYGVSRPTISLLVRGLTHRRSS